MTCHAGYASTWRGRWHADKRAIVRNRRCGRHWGGEVGICAAISTRHVVLCTPMDVVLFWKTSRGAIEWHRHFTPKFRLIKTPRLTDERGKCPTCKKYAHGGKSTY